MQIDVFNGEIELQRTVAQFVADAITKLDRTYPETRLLGVRDVAARLDASIPTVWRLVKRGELNPPRRLGDRRAAWLSTDIDAFLLSLPFATTGINPVNRKVSAPINASGVHTPRRRGRPRKYPVAAPVSITAAASGN